MPNAAKVFAKGSNSLRLKKYTELLDLAAAKKDSATAHATPPSSSKPWPAKKPCGA